MQKTRRTFQIIFFLAVVFLTVKNLLHLTKATVESYCPGGGLESLYFYIKNSSFLCATSGINLIMFLGIFFGSILIGRAFCSWICPIGTLVEFLSYVGKKGKIIALSFWRGPFGKLSWFRYVVLALVIYYTYVHSDLIFRPFCPLYVVLSGQSHEIAWWSKWLILAIVGITIAIPFFWCKVLCPLGATLGLARYISPLAPTIDKSNCILCGKCSDSCPQQIDVMQKERVTDADCTQCGVCIDNCPKDCLGFKFGYKKLSDGVGDVKYLPKYILPLLIFLMMFLAFYISFKVPVPTLTKNYSHELVGKTGKVDMIVKNLRCRGTSNLLSYILETNPGIISLETYVSEHKARIVYDKSKTSPENIKLLIEKGIDKKFNNKVYHLRFKVEKILP